MTVLDNFAVTATGSRRLPRWSELKALFKEWRERSRSRYELASLTDRELWDIGLNRMQADNETNKPFWQA